MNLYFAKPTPSSFPKLKWLLPASHLWNLLCVISDSSAANDSARYCILPFPQYLKWKSSGQRTEPHLGLPDGPPAIFLFPWVYSLQCLFHTFYLKE